MVTVATFGVRLKKCQVGYDIKIEGGKLLCELCRMMSGHLPWQFRVSNWNLSSTLNAGLGYQLSCGTVQTSLCI